MWPFKRKDKPKGKLKGVNNYIVSFQFYDPYIISPKKKIQEIKRIFPSLKASDIKEIREAFHAGYKGITMTVPEPPKAKTSGILEWHCPTHYSSCDCGDAYSTCCGGKSLPISFPASRKIGLTPEAVENKTGTFLPPSLQYGCNALAFSIFGDFELTDEDWKWFEQIRAELKPKDSHKTIGDLIREELNNDFIEIDEED